MRSLPALVLLLALSACDAPLEGTDAGPLADGSSLLDDAGFTPDAGPPPADGGLADAGSLGDSGAGDAGPPPPPDPGDIFFVGNSFTFGGPIPTLVHDLAVAAGHAEPRVEYRAEPGRPLSWHRADPSVDGAPNRVGEGWDVVVLQEQSTRPTDSIGDPDQFKDDATWFYDLAKMANPAARVVLYETWARRAGHEYYPVSFDDPADMQAQLRFHYFDAAGFYIPTFSTSAVRTDVTVAPCGDAWERQLAMGEPPRLHAGDDWHAGPAGQYLNALVIYSTIYGRRARGLVPLRVDAETAALLQSASDETTGATRLAPALEDPLPIAEGDGIRADLGPTVAADWPALTTISDSVGPVAAMSSAPTNVHASVAGFTGTQTGGSATNGLGWPGDVSADSLYVGTFDGHDAALSMRATATLRGLPRGAYEVVVFASRDGDDGGRGRLTRYRIGAVERDLDVAGNTDAVASFAGVRPDELGEVRVEIAVSPGGGARFAYLGALVVTRTGP